MDSITLLLALEARDRATQIINKVSKTVKEWEASVKAAATQAGKSATAVEAANQRAAASSASYERALASQRQAQQALATAMEASKARQTELAVATEQGGLAQQRAAAMVEKAAAEEEAALIRLQEAEKLAATRAKEMADAQAAASTKTGAGAAVLKGAVVAAGATALAVGLIGTTAVKAAGDYQAATTRFVTSAGEQEKNLDLVRQGILKMEGDVGYGSEALTAAMYKIESGGQHGADGLLVLKAAAQGAKTENADLTTVADAVTSVLVDYHLKASDAADVTSKMVAATSAGKTTFEELAGAMSSILPVASAAGVPLSDILGDLASMTVHGMSASQAAQNLADTIRHMQNPTAVQAKELALLGMTTNQLADDLRTKGLSGTLNEISERVRNLMPPGSTKVILDLRTALEGLDPQVQKLALHLFDGSMSYKDYLKASKDLPPILTKQAQSFATLAGTTHQIGSEQMSGAQVMQSYGQALAKATGDATGLNTILMVSGENSGVTAKAIQTVSDATVEAGGNVKGWSDIQDTLNFKLAALKGKLEAAKISLGTGLIPAVTSLVTHVLQVVGPITTWMAAHEHLTTLILGTILALSTLVLTIAAVVKTVTVLKTAWEGMILVGGKLAPIANLWKLALAEASTAMATAAPTAGTLGTAVAGVTGAARGAASGVGAMLAAINPWVVAITGAAVVAGVFAKRAEEQRQRVNALADAMMALGRAYRQTHDLSSQAVQDAILQNRDLTDLVTKTRLYGLTVQQVTEAVAGNSDAERQVLAAMQAHAQELEKQLALERGAQGTYTEKGKQDKKQLDALNAQIDALKKQFGELDKNDAAVKALNEAQKQSTQGTKTLTESDQDLVTKLEAMRRGTVDAATASDTLKAAQDRLHGGQIALTEAQQNYAEQVVQLTDSLKENGHRWDLSSEAGIRNRQSLEGALKATVDLYDAQVAAQVPEQEAIKTHDKNVDALRRQAQAAGLSKDEIDKLIKTYGSVPNKVTTELVVLGYADAAGKLNSIGQIAEHLVETFGVDVQTAVAIANSGLAQNKPHPHAAGGPVFGPGTGTSDSIPALLSNGEHVWTAAEVQAAGGHAMVAALRHAALTGRIGGDGAALSGFANGGQVGPDITLHWQSNVSQWPAYQAFARHGDSANNAMQRMMAGVLSGFANGGPGYVGVRDRGGPVYPGVNMIYNGTGSTEWINDPRGGGQGRQVVIDLRESSFWSPRDIDDLLDRIDARLVRELLPGAGVQIRR